MKVPLAVCWVFAASAAGCGGNTRTEAHARDSVFGVVDVAAATVSARTAAQSRVDAGTISGSRVNARTPDVASAPTPPAAQTPGTSLETDRDDAGETSENTSGSSTRGDAGEPPAINLAEDAGQPTPTAAASFAPAYLLDGGSITLQTQADVEALRGVTVIDGDLWITGQVEDLSPLQFLGEITGSLYVSEAYELKNLHGLEGLTQIGAGLYIRSFCDIQSSPIPCVGNPKLQTLEALDHLVTVGGDVEIAPTCYWHDPVLDCAGNSALERIGLNALTSANSVLVSRNDSLVALDGFNSLAAVPGRIVIEWNPVLTSVTALGALTDAWLWFRYNPVLSDISGLSNWTHARTLTLDNNALTHLDGLGSLIAADSIYVEEPAVTNLHGLAGLLEVDNLELWASVSDLHGLEGLTISNSLAIRHTMIASLEGLGQLLPTARIYMDGVHNLKNLDALVGVSELSGIDIRRCPSLADFTGLSGLTAVGTLSLRELPLLPNLDSLSNLTQIHSLFLIENDSLGNLAALSGVTQLDPDGVTLNELVIEHNHTLPPCEPALLCDRLDAPYCAIDNNYGTGACSP